MAKEKPTPDERVEAAREELEQAQIDAAKTTGQMRPLVCVVSAGTSVKDEFGDHHGEGDEVVLDGLTAVGLAQAGLVTITGTEELDALPPDEDEDGNRPRQQAAMKAEERRLKERLDAHRDDHKKLAGGKK